MKLESIRARPAVFVDGGGIEKCHLPSEFASFLKASHGVCTKPPPSFLNAYQIQKQLECFGAGAAVARAMR